MNRLGFPWIAMSLIFTVGCDGVYSNRPMGQEIASISRENWDGVWIGAEGAFTVQVIDEEAGELRVSWIQEVGGFGGSPKTTESQSLDVHLRRSGSWLFASAADPDDSERFGWARIKRDDRQLIVWAPRVSAFDSLIAEGALPGTVREEPFLGQPRKVITLGDLSAEHFSLITTSARGILLDWEEPMVLMRLRD